MTTLKKNYYTFMKVLQFKTFISQIDPEVGTIHGSSIRIQHNE